MRKNSKSNEGYRNSHTSKKDIIKLLNQNFQKPGIYLFEF